MLRLGAYAGDFRRELMLRLFSYAFQLRRQGPACRGLRSDACLGHCRFALGRRLTFDSREVYLALLLRFVGDARQLAYPLQCAFGVYAFELGLQSEFDLGLNQRNVGRPHSRVCGCHRGDFHGPLGARLL